MMEWLMISWWIIQPFIGMIWNGHDPTIQYNLIGGLEHVFFQKQLGISSPQLTNKHIFQRGRYNANQINDENTYVLLEKSRALWPFDDLMLGNMQEHGGSKRLPAAGTSGALQKNHHSFVC